MADISKLDRRITIGLEWHGKELKHTVRFCGGLVCVNTSRESAEQDALDYAKNRRSDSGAVALASEGHILALIKVDNLKLLVCYGAQTFEHTSLQQALQDYKHCLGHYLRSEGLV